MPRSVRRQGESLIGRIPTLQQSGFDLKSGHAGFVILQKVLSG